MQIHPSVAVLIGGLLLAVAGCAQEKEWMKVGSPYTTAEFRRDYADCTRSGGLDEDCMRSRGWVSVTPGRAEKPEPPPEQQQLRRPGRY
jgi:hypothetical protein